MTDTIIPPTDPQPPVKVIAEPVPLATVNLIGTPSDDIPKAGTVAVTPGARQPNLVVGVIITPIVAILIRFLNVYIGAVVGLVTAGLTSNAIPAQDFAHLVLKCAGLAIGGAIVLLLKDVITVLGKLENKYPLLTGSI